MKNKYNKRIDEIAFSNSLMEVYKKVLDGSLESFPYGTWRNFPLDRSVLIPIIKYAIEEVCGYKTVKDFTEKYTYEDLMKKAKLSGMITIIFNGSGWDAISLAYPGIPLWEFKTKKPRIYWEDEKNAIGALRWLINDKLKWSHEEVVENYSRRFLVDNCLRSPLESNNNDSFKLLEMAFPGQYQSHELKRISTTAKYTSKDDTLQYLKQIFDAMSDNELKQLSYRFFLDKGLYKVYRKYGSAFNILDAIYPGRFKAWELKVPLHFWDSHKNVKNALQWVAEKEGIDLNSKTAPRIRTKDLRKHGLYCIIRKWGGIEDVLKIGLPDNYNNWNKIRNSNNTPSSNKKWEYDKESSLMKIYKELLYGGIKKFPNGTWTGTQANRYECIPLIKYALEEICGYKSEQEILDRFTSSDLIENKLRGMVIHAFGSSTFEAVICAYPKLKVWQFKTYAPKKFWDNENNIIMAVKWLIEEKLQWTDQDVLERFSLNTLKENGLTSVLNKFDGRPFKVLEFVYPDKFVIYNFKNIHNASAIVSESDTLQYIKNLLDNMNDEQIVSLNRKFFTNHKLSTTLVKHSTIYNLVNEIYPKRFKVWQFKVPKGYWDNEQNIIDAMRWMLERRGIDPDSTQTLTIQNKDYMANGLSGMLFKKFNGIAHAPIKKYFPNLEILPTKKQSKKS